MASWWMVIPLRHSAACCTTEPTRVAGPVAPARGMETNSAGMPARAQSIMFWQVISLHSRGGEGQTSNTAIGLAARASSLPTAATSRFFMMAQVSMAKAPVTTGFRAYLSTR